MTEENTTVETENANAEVDTKSEQQAPATFSLNEFYALKAGMTRYFNEDGKNVPVTVLKLIPNKVTQVKTQEKEGYNAYQVGYYSKRENLINKPTKGHLKKSGTSENFARFFEVRVDSAEKNSIGKELDIVSNFTPESFVDVTGMTKGKGFQGVMKRYGFRGGPATHGSKFHRTGGSIGNRATPGRVFKLKKMPGHMGNKQRTMQNIKIMEVNTDMGYMLVKGSIPGHKNSFVKIKKSIKK